LSYITVRGEGKMEGARREQGAVFVIPFPLHISAGWSPTCVLVTVNEAQRYLATSIQYSYRNIPRPEYTTIDIITYIII
jgi:hypothetical protein